RTCNKGSSSKISGIDGRFHKCPTLLSDNSILITRPSSFTVIPYQSFVTTSLNTPPVFHPELLYQESPNNVLYRMIKASRSSSSSSSNDSRFCETTIDCLV